MLLEQINLSTSTSKFTFAGLFWKEYDKPVAIGVACNVGLCGDKYIECLLDTLLGEADWLLTTGRGDSGGISWNKKNDLTQH